jgi:hypothetical protein
MLAIWKLTNEKPEANESARVEAQKSFSAKAAKGYFDLLDTTSLIAK